MHEVEIHGHPVDDALVVHGVENFAGRIDAAEVVVLMLDYDGTLAPFHVDRMQARPLPQVLDALRYLASQSNVTPIIISGRPVPEVQTLLGTADITIIGSHGYERYDSGAGVRAMPIGNAQGQLLDDAHETALALVAADRVERKVASVAVHIRGLSDEQQQSVGAAIVGAWAPMVVGGSTELRPFNGGLELRAVGRSKGTAVREVLEGNLADALPIYIGDDDTDEDAFAALPHGGIGIKVGSPGAATHAQGRLPDCEAVERLLVAWSERKANA